MAKILLDSNRPINVLIVDDSLVVRERLVTILDELAGVEIVGQVENVAEAVRAIRLLRPHVVILDIRLPDGSGIDVLQSIKRDKVTPIIIILTNYPFPEYRQRCLNAGANFFLDKSTEFDQIPTLFAEFRQALHSDD
jgi:DNA-binding NarL/FixJ family response regulator